MTRPWEIAVGTRPWEQQQPLYQRTLTFKRQTAVSGHGLQGYSGDVKANETIIAAGVPGNVSISSSGRNSASGGLPGDSAGPIKWTITLSPSALVGLPLIIERDLVYDDLGRRFQVAAFETEAAGARIDTVRLIA